MSDINLALILLGAFWAGTSSVFAGIRLVAEIQDRIVVGKLDGQVLPVRYRKFLLVIHWLPLKLALGIISLVLGVIIIELPGLRTTIPTPDPFCAVCYWAAVMPFVGFGYQLVGAVLDGRFLHQVLRHAEAKSPARDEDEAEPPARAPWVLQGSQL